MGVTRQLRLYGWTLANMRNRQLLGVVERAGRNHVLPRLPVDLDESYECDPPPTAALDTAPVAANLDALRASLDDAAISDYRDRAADAATGRVQFLNQTVDLSGDPIRWDHEALGDLPRLWRLKLHGFEPLYWLVASSSPDSERAREHAAAFETWIDDWLDRHPVGEEAYLRRGWTPYSVSNRVVNWSRFCAWQAAGGLTPSAALRAGIRKNAAFLASNVEHDVGGNHVIENGVALVVAGTLLPDGDDLFRKGCSILADAADEQFLLDGGHYERSPMYHVQVLTGYLTALDLCARTGRSCPDAVAEAARRGLEFLAALAPPDGRIPLLNDAVFGETLALPAVWRYASRVDGTGWTDPEADATRRSRAALGSSGYYWLGGGDDRLLVDGGPVGPPHLPGHSHNDLLSVLLWVDGQRVVADTGTYSYAPGERRQYARGVRGHSTVQVGAREPIELGRRFLMGKRTAPETAFRSGAVDAFRGEYTAHCGYTHARRVYGTDAWWLVWDRVTDAGPDPVRSRLTLHPDIRAQASDDPTEVPVTGPDGDPLAWVYPLRTDDVTRTEGSYFPRFGAERVRDVLELTAERSADGFGYVVATEPQDSVSVDTDGSAPSTLTLGPTTLEVPTV